MSVDIAELRTIWDHEATHKTVVLRNYEKQVRFEVRINKEHPDLLKLDQLEPGHLLKIYRATDGNTVFASNSYHRSKVITGPDFGKVLITYEDIFFLDL